MEAEQFFAANAVDGQLTDEQMARFLTGNGDAAIEEQPALDIKEEVTEEVKEEEVKLEEEKPVILAKDGVHTIEYEKLVEAREEAKLAKQEAETLKAALAEREALLESLKEAKAQDEATGTTEAMDALAASVTEDFPELLELMNIKTATMEKNFQAQIAELQKQIAPALKSSNEQVEEKFFSEVRKHVSDIDEIRESRELIDWVESHPKAVAEGYRQTWQTGSLEDVVKMANAFKATKTPAPAGDTAEQIALKAAAAEEKAKGKSVPKSLSDIPAGTAAHHDEAEAIKNMTPLAIMGKFANKSSNEILTMLDRTIK